MTALDRAGDLVRGLAVAGLAAAGTRAAAEASDLALDLERSGMPEGSRRLGRLAGALGGPPEEATRALLGVVAWLDVVRRSVDRAALRARLAAGDAPPPSAESPRASAVVSVDAVSLGTRRATYRGRDESGGPVVVHDRLPDLDADDPFDQPVASALFRGPVRLREALRHTVVLKDHPVEHRGRMRVFHPALRTGARNGSLRDPSANCVEAVVRRGPLGAGIDGPFGPVDGPRVRAVLARLLRREGRDELVVDVAVVRKRDGVDFGCLERDGTLWWGPSDPGGFPVRRPSFSPPPFWTGDASARQAAWSVLLRPDAPWPEAGVLRSLAAAHGERLPVDRLRALVASSMGRADEGDALALAVEQGWEAEWCG